MGLTKAALFTKSQNEIAMVAKALAHPARIAILQFLAKKNACICGDIVDEIGLAQATISQHLKELKMVGIIRGNIEGTSICYCIDPDVWNKFRDLFSTFFTTTGVGETCC